MTESRTEVPTTTRPRTICIGETMAMLTSADASPMATASAVTLTPGGAESNLAQHLGEGGCEPMWISQLGEDPLGTRILDSLEAAGIDTSHVTRTSAANTAMYVKDPTPKGSRVYYYRKGSAFSMLGPEAVGSWPLAEAVLVHMSGITLALSDSCRAMVAEVESRVAEIPGTLMSFDVNYRPSLWGVEEAARVIREAARRADIVLVGLDEAQTLWGVETSEQAAALFPEARYVVIKDGANEAVEFARVCEGSPVPGGAGIGDALSNAGAPLSWTVTRVPAREVEVVEPVGAGDAFAGGYLAGLLRAMSSQDRLRLGHSMAAWVLQCAEDNRPGHGPDIRA